MRPTVAATLLAALLAAAPARAQAPLSPAARAALGLTSDAAAAAYDEGRAATAAFRLEAARAAFARVSQLAPASPAGAFGAESTALWAALADESAASVERFEAANDTLVAHVRRLPDGADRDLWDATATLHRALLLARRESYTRAGSAFRDACGTYRRLAAAPEPLADARFGQGLCEIAAGAVPRKYRWLARLLGFSGTVGGGLDLLALAAEGDGVQSVEAAVVLALVDQTLNEGRGQGLQRLQALAAATPGSPVLAYLEGYLLLTERRAGEAEAALRRARAALAAPGAAPFPFVDAHLGLALYRQGRFAEAAPMLDGYVRTVRGPALAASSALAGGLAYEMTGDRGRAEALYRRVRARRDYDSDLASEREARRRLGAPLTASGRRLAEGGAAYDGGRYDEAIRLLQPVVTDAALPASERAEAAYRTGRALHALGQLDDALRHYRLAVSNPGEDAEAKWGPWSLYHVGEVLERQGDAAGARRAYRDVLADEREFDYSKALEQRARTASDRLSR